MSKCKCDHDGSGKCCQDEENASCSCGGAGGCVGDCDKEDSEDGE